MTSIILKAIDLLTGPGVSEKKEGKGIDISLHNETGYGRRRAGICIPMEDNPTGKQGEET